MGWLSSLSWAGVDNLAVDIQLTQSSYESADRVVIRYQIMNTSDQAIGILDWKLPKEVGEWEDDLFDISRDGQPVIYKGRHVKRPSIGRADYRYLKPGQKIKGKATLSDAYDFSENGYYSIRYHVRAMRLTSDFSEKTAASVEAFSSEVVSAYVGGRLYAKPDGGGDCKGKNCPSPDGFYACSDERKAIIGQAHTAASVISNESYDYMLGANNNSQRYAQWFGVYDTQRWDKVVTDFAATAGAIDHAPLEYDCGCKSPYYAYVYADQPYKIYFCKTFWSSPVTGHNSMASTILHEVSHFIVVAATDDVVYGYDDSAALAVSDPDVAVTNADNLSYFAENTPAIP